MADSIFDSILSQYPAPPVSNRDPGQRPTQQLGKPPLIDPPAWDPWQPVTFTQRPGEKLAGFLNHQPAIIPVVTP